MDRMDHYTPTGVKGWGRSWHPSAGITLSSPSDSQSLSYMSSYKIWGEVIEKQYKFTGQKKIWVNILQSDPGTWLGSVRTKHVFCCSGKHWSLSSSTSVTISQYLRLGNLLNREIYCLLVWSMGSSNHCPRMASLSCDCCFHASQRWVQHKSSHSKQV
jgi:hypothetical protein